MIRPPLFRGAIATTTTKYVGLPVHAGCLGAQIAWLDGVSAAAVTLELTSFDSDSAPTDVAGTYQWKDSGLTIAGPTGAAVGSTLLNVENVRQHRARLKIVTTAASNFEIYDGIP